jgi:hypothetical protein
LDAEDDGDESGERLILKMRVVLLLFFFPVSLFAQNSPECIIKFSGDTLIYDHVDCTIKRSKLVKVTGRTGSTLTDIPVGEVRFFIFDSTTVCWTGLGRAEVLAFSAQYILGQIWDKDRKMFDVYFFSNDLQMIEQVSKTKKCPDQLIKYFGSCEEFKKEVEAERAVLSKKFSFPVFYGLVRPYNKLCNTPKKD